MVETFLTFVETTQTGKTRKYDVFSTHSGDILGHIHWRSGWRRYVMSFDKDCDWSVECMAECYKFVQKLMEDRNK